MDKAIQKLMARLDEVEAKLGHAATSENQRQYRELAQEHAYLNEIRMLWNEKQSLLRQSEDNEKLISHENEGELVEMAREDNADIEKKLLALQVQLEKLLIPPDPNDSRNTILELRAGTGGEEAALFVADCARMYKMCADRLGWKYELLSCTPSDLGGFREYVMVLSGKDVYRNLQYEGGTHRVQRIPETEAQGRVHTSAITIAVLLEPDETSDVVIDEGKELRVDTFRSSGAGGQHVNTTDSAVRLTHIPTGIVVACQDERSQHKNKEKAMRLLKAKIAEERIRKQHEAISSNRAQQVGSGDRSERIRTYNFPQNRLTDHRINLTKYNLDLIMDGVLADVFEVLIAHYRSSAMESVG